ncbi:MAG: hypothetical protein NDJ92_06175 [Thermoanaerobaculia bacterium]|nr:hypothetical protein [Thermoanaerobaculia bacterium]
MPNHRLILLAAVAVVATSAYATDPGTATKSPARPDAPECSATVAAEVLPIGEGLRAFIDSKTGQLRQPTAEELAAISAASRTARNKSIEGLEVEYRRDGSKFVDLQGRFMHSLRVTRTADGSKSYTCTDREPHAHPHTPSPAAPAAPAEK